MAAKSCGVTNKKTRSNQASRLFICEINCFQTGNCMVRFDTLKTALIFVKVENRIKNS